MSLFLFSSAFLDATDFFFLLLGSRNSLSSGIGEEDGTSLGTGSCVHGYKVLQRSIEEIEIEREKREITNNNFYLHIIKFAKNKIQQTNIYINWA